MSEINNNRIAKNTVLLYLRTLLVMVVSLYTSRVILHALGVEDYGVYQVVGGMVAMFSVISAALSSAISRFITFELGKSNYDKLNKIFATSVIIQIIISLIVLVLAEIFGIWFMENKMQIPEGRMFAAQWVLQCSLVTFCINLLSVPYNACIIAHEHMKAFAYVSILEALLKLGICFLIGISPFDRLISYAVLLMLLSLLIRSVYAVYCHRHFEESRVRLAFDKPIFKEMFGYAGWSFVTNTINVFNNQGLTLLINVFFGVTFNAARGVASQVENSVNQFVNSFTTAINPQITKSYANDDLNGMYGLVCRGAKFSYFLMLLMALPIIAESEVILHIWLKDVPQKAVILVQLSLIMGLLDSIGRSCFTACMATGRIKKYALIVSAVILLEFPLSWIAFSLGGKVEMAYYLFILIKALTLVVRMFLMQNMIGLKVKMFFLRVLLPIISTTFIAVIPSIIIVKVMLPSYLRLAISLVVGVIMVGFSSFFIGMYSNERRAILRWAKKLIYKSHA